MANDHEASLIIRLKDGVSDGLGKIKASLADLANKIPGVAAVFAALVATITKATSEYAKQEDSITKLNVALKNSGQFSEKNSQDLQALAESLQHTTGFADDAIIAMQAMALTFGFTTAQVEQLTPRIIDLAAKTGMDLNSAMLAVGKSIELGTSAPLKRMGTVVDDTAFKAHDFTGVLKTLDDKFAGTGEAMNKTTSGQLKQLGLGIEDIFKAIGKLINGPMTLWIGKFNELTQATAEFLARWANYDASLAETGKTATSLMAIQQKQVEQLKDEKVALEAQLQAHEKNNAFIANETEKRARLAVVIEQLASTEKALTTTTIKAGAERVQAAADEEAARKKAEQIAHKAQIAELDAQTKKILAKENTRADSIKLLSKNFTNEQARTIAANLSNTEIAEDLDHVKRLEQLGAFNDAKLVLDSMYNKANEDATKKHRRWEDLSNEERVANFSQTMSFISSLSSAHNKTLATIGKAAAISVATIDTYQAANKALASAPPPWNFALAGLVVTAGIANVARISGVPLAEGGVVMPRAGGTLATIGEAGSPEAVIPLNDDRAKKMLGGGGGTNIHIHAGTIVADPLSVRKFATMIDKELFKLERNKISVRT